jgi:hypothetical protein
MAQRPSWSSATRCLLSIVAAAALGACTDSQSSSDPPADAGAGASAPDDASPPDGAADADLSDASDSGLPDGPAPSEELLLYDGDGLQFTEADNGFHALIVPGDPLPAPDWSSPVDYYQGEMEIRYVIGDPADQQPGVLQTCIWTIGNEDGDGRDYFPESCSAEVAHAGVGEYVDTGVVVSQWWRNEDVPLVFAHPERFRIGAVLRGQSGCNVTTYDVAGACWNEWPSYQNMIFRVTMVMVPPGKTFSGWGSYP